MKMKKSRIEEIIREELATHLGELLAFEADDKDKEPEVATADAENTDLEPDTPSKNVAPTVGDKKDDDTPEGDQESPKDSPIGDGESPDAEVPVGDDPADSDISKDVVEPEPEDEGDIGGDISDDLVGKQIQSITMEPESKMMPGAREITIQIENHPHPLKILLGKSGMIKFFYRGSLHNEL